MATSSVFSSCWLVADMDGTLLPDPGSVHGQFLPFSHSVAFEPIIRFLEAGGCVCVITTAATRTFRQIWGSIPEHLKTRERSVVCCISGGGALYYNNAQGQLAEDVDYRQHSIEGGTVLSPSDAEDLATLARNILLQYFHDLRSDRTPLEVVSTKYRVPFTDILEGRRGPLEEALSMQLLRARDGILAPGFGQQALVDVSTLADPNSGEVIGASSVSFGGIPRDFAARYIDAHRDPLLARGICLSVAPNSVWFQRVGVDKALPIRWLEKTPAYSFSLARSFAAGDNPQSNDGPLASVPGLTFVSMAPDPSKIAPELLRTHVGGFEKGTALVMSNLVDRAATASTATTLTDELFALHLAEAVAAAQRDAPRCETLTDETREEREAAARLGRDQS
eukprot:gnl/Spiro4/11052_TR5858_c0_g1_i1.p1 gnl/Spiro4/11052_TR5858_c0_g1~~gnl/Spiro4/11052_TR5858_c0_g1_i1.p1  ORF type:complete len:402 (-),score=101.97 gnl/Spiro4/11052_TR5858_c0_g1_i1:140-1318(-)